MCVHHRLPLASENSERRRPGHVDLHARRHKRNDRMYVSRVPCVVCSAIVEMVDILL